MITTSGERARSRFQVVVPILLVAFGAICGVTSLALISNQFGNTDSLGLILFGVASWMVVTGVSHIFIRLPMAAVIGAVAAPLMIAALFVLYWVALFATASGNRHHDDFAANRVAQIPPARQMDGLFDDCRHNIRYGPNGVPQFNSVAYFGDRYQLTMQVPVRIDSASSGAMVGEPTFHLNEVSKVTVSPSGQVQASFSRGIDFGSAEWALVYNADGDFSQIGFVTKPTGIPNFQVYAGALQSSD